MRKEGLSWLLKKPIAFRKTPWYEKQLVWSAMCHWWQMVNCGEVPERPKGADCKSAGEAFGGSNPPLSTTA